MGCEDKLEKYRAGCRKLFLFCRIPPAPLFCLTLPAEANKLVLEFVVSPLH